MNNTWLSSKTSDSRSVEKDNDKLSRIVSAVIDEYDVIDDSTVTSINNRGNGAIGGSEKKCLNNPSVSAELPNEQTIISYPRINCKEKIVCRSFIIHSLYTNYNFGVNQSSFKIKGHNSYKEHDAWGCDFLHKYT
jgi:hypothetical protein